MTKEELQKEFEEWGGYPPNSLIEELKQIEGLTGLIYINYLQDYVIKLHTELLKLAQKN